MDDALVWLITLGRQVDIQAQLHEETRSWLFQRAENALQNGILKDQIWKSLMRIGTHAYKYLIRQEAALEWSLARGKAAQAHESRKDIAFLQLSTRCQTTLARLNKREMAYIFLKNRATKALRLEKMKYESIIYLRHFPEGRFVSTYINFNSGIILFPIFSLCEQLLAIWKAAAKIEKTFLSLKAIGIKAINHYDKKFKAWSFLQAIVSSLN